MWGIWYLPLSGLFHLVWRSLGPSMLLQMALFHSFYGWVMYLVAHYVWLFATPWTIVHQAPLSMGILQATILEWIAMPYSSGSSKPRDKTQVSHISGGFFTSWATREALINIIMHSNSLLIDKYCLPKIFWPIWLHDQKCLQSTTWHIKYTVLYRN